MEKLGDIPTRIAVRAILTNAEGEVLLARRASGTYEAGKWCLVGGKPDEGENLETGVVRETQEEIGVRFDPSYYGEIENPDVSSGQRWRTRYYTGEVDAIPTEIDKREVAEVGFFGSSELNRIEMAFNHKAVLTQFFGEREED